MTNIASPNTIAAIAHLIGDTTRANMLCALMGGQALTAGELSRQAGITAQTGSGHLAKMVDANLLSTVKQGRHRYYRLASRQVAHGIDALMNIAADGPKRHHPVGPKEKDMRTARSCYDHIAGRLAVAMADSLSTSGRIILSDEGALVTDDGKGFLKDFGIDLDDGTRSKRPLCLVCLDWSERRHHIAGRVGAALLDRTLELGWIARRPDSRALRITPLGDRGFRDIFCLPADWNAV
ncbi:ArsR/SmtB family transcription factor [Agrobacterium sp. rho-13.3]|uniref:ArsR/SmtB family transcription factor n=1 Tax=Agrobacterium sp. rho-13.3 TaxID=3072980 RepID=UPI002A0EE969|nr:helix-turn-helix transcriptional regulator [Agrobacterium sp. rho-13.3]MDX8308931.1 helix-turn-helix transcriptional regulator [Agrobacterium sp. rho-13.3]